MGGDEAASGGALADGEDKEDGLDGADAIEAFAELDALLAEPTIAELPPARQALLGAQDTLTATPTEADTVLYAVPVCAPYSVLVSYRYRIKLTPGNQKRGKAAKQAVGLLCASTASPRERELMLALTDDELVRAMVGNVKLAAGGKMLQSQKKDKKAQAVARVKKLREDDD